MKKNVVCLALVGACLAVGLSDAREKKEYDSDVNYDESKIPPYDLPPLLVTAEGAKVATAGQWRNTRRPQILSLFSNLVYGQVPAPRARSRRNSSKSRSTRPS